MTDDELRALVKDAIVRHLGATQAARGQAVHPAHDARTDPPWRAHPSFGRFLVVSGGDEGGACLIEPAVECNHCGFCQSYGH